MIFYDESIGFQYPPSPMTHATRQPLVAVMRSLQPRVGPGMTPSHAKRPRAPRYPKGPPDLRRILPVDHDGIVRRCATLTLTFRAGFISRSAPIDEDPLSIQ